MRRYILTIALTVGFLPGNTAQSKERQSQLGYITCERYSPQGVPVYESLCAISFPKDFSPAERIACDQTVSVVGRDGSWLKVIRSDGRTGYIFSTEVSRNKKHWVEFNLPGPKELDVGTCFTPKIRSDQPGKLPPHPIYSPSPEIGSVTSHRLEGSVLLTVTVGTDGLIHDVKVEKSLDPALDQKAVETVQHWRFDPAIEDGKPIPFTMHIEVAMQVLGNRQ